MKTKLIIGTAILMGVTGVALAYGPGDGPHDRGARFAQIDTNHDGKISKEERAAAKAKVFARFDTNGDGNVTMEEYQKGIEKMRAERMERRFKSMDTNGDGKVSKAEFEAAKSHCGRHHHPRYHD